jgi:AcrR family transcriptional regulator
MARATRDAAKARPKGGAGSGRRRNNRRGQGERLRDDLIEAASAMVAETGDAGSLSLRAVAARVGVAATSVYLHFADLDALKIAVAQRSFAEFAAARDAATAGITDPAEALVARCQAYAHFGLTHPGHYRLMLGPDLPPLARPGDTSAPSMAAFTALAGSIRRCQQAGAAPADADPEWLATLVWTALHGQTALRMDRPHFPWPPLDDSIDALVRRLVRLPAAHGDVTSGPPGK